MQFQIVHEIPQRIRLRLIADRTLEADESLLKGCLAEIPGIDRLCYKPLTHSLVVTYNGRNDCRRSILTQLEACCISSFKRKRIETKPVDKKDPGNNLQKKKRALMRRTVMRLFRPLLPLPFRVLMRGRYSLRIIRKGVAPLMKGELNSDVLDAAAVCSALALREYGTVGTISFLLQISDYLEAWTRQKSKERLSGLFSIEEEWAWILKDIGEVKIPLQQITTGDIVVVREGNKLPVDGVVVEGEALVNQACMTGEALPVRKYKSVSVYAGTVLAEGKLLVKAERVAGNTRVSQMMRIIDESEELKASVQSKAEKLADSIVPYSFLLSALTWMVTGSVYKAASALLVDYSCAIKLSTPLTLMSAMIAASKKGVLIKGGKFIEKMALADTFVLDKTGTLTEAKPKVIDIIPFNGFERDYLLRNVACVEEHFPHPVASAVVRKALEENLDHDEQHSEVNHIVAHGIASEIDGKEILVGSRHYIHEDSGVAIDFSLKEVEQYLEEGRSLLYIAIGGELAGIVVIEDPIRPGAGRFIKSLQKSGVRKVVMLTGDNQAAAKKVADCLNIKDYCSQVFPEDKTRIIRELQESAYTVAMVGDGMNDTPALAGADIGISMKQGADLAREVCDVLLLHEDLNAIVFARRLSQKTLSRIKSNYFSIIGINSLLIGLGIFGAIPPIMSAFMHNATTVLVAANSLRKFQVPND